MHKLCMYTPGLAIALKGKCKKNQINFNFKLCYEKLQFKSTDLILWKKY